MRQPVMKAVFAVAAGAAVAILPIAPHMPRPLAAQEIMPTPTPTPTQTPTGMITPTPTPTPPGFVKVPVPGSSTSASTNDGNVPANSADGNLNTRWSGFGSGAWLQFDLGSTRRVAQIKVAAHLGNQRRNMFEIHTSADAMSWNPALMAQTSGTTTQLEQFSIPGTPLARYVRYVGRGNSDPAKAGWNSVSEMEVWVYPSGPPAAPTNLRAQPDAGKVTLTWDAASTSQFQIWRRLSQCDTYAQVGTSNATTFTDTTVTDRRHYYYYVVGVTSGGTSPPSDPIAVTPQIQPPPAPTVTVTAGPVDSGRVTVSWGVVARNPIRYVVRRAPWTGMFCNEQSAEILATVDAPATTYTDTTAVPGKGYAYVVSAVNVTGEGLPSARAMVNVPSSAPVPTSSPTPCPTGTPTPTPVLPRATPPTPTQADASPAIGRVRLRWTAPSTYPNHARSFRIYRATAACGPYAQVAIDVPGYMYIDSGLTNGTTYYYFVVGWNQLGESLDSEIVGATPRDEPPAVPPRPDVYDSGNSGLTISVPYDFAADSYTFKRSTSSGGPYSVLATVTIPAPAASGGVFHEDHTAVAGTTYYYVVEAVNAAGPSGNSPEAPGTAPGGAAAPTGLVATSGSGSISLSWSPVPNASIYRVYRASSRCGTFGAIGSPTGTSFVDSIGGNGRYLYRVTALEGSREGDPSAIVSGTPGVSYAGPTLSIVGGNPSLQLSWSPVAGADGYRIFRRPPFQGSCQPTTNEVLQTVGSGTTAFTDTVVSPGMTYVYTVSASVNGWPSNPSVSTSGTTGGTNEFPTPTPPACPTPTPTFAPPPPSGPLMPPSNITTTAGDRQAIVTWSNGSGAFGHNIYRSTSACGPFVRVMGRAYWEPSTFTDVGLVNGVTYYYLIVGTSSAGESAEPPVASVTPVAQAPSSVPRNIFGVGGDARVKVQWSPVYGATSYVVRRAPSVAGATFIDVGTSVIDSFVDTGVTNGASYWYQVAAINAAGRGPAGSMAGNVTPRSTSVEVTPAAGAVTASTHDGNVPGNTVDNNLATRWSGNGSTGNAWVQYDLGVPRRVTHITVAVYQGNARRNSFDIAVSTDGTSFTTYTGYVTSGTTTAEQTHDVPDTWARYVRYVGHGGTITATGASTTWNSVTEVSIFAEPGSAPTPTPTPTPDCPTPPPLPTSPPPPTVAATGTAQGILVEWTSAYHRNRVLRATTPGGPYTLVADVANAPSGSFTDTNVTMGTPYYYVVHAYDQTTSAPGCPPWTWTLNGPRSTEVSAVAGSPICSAWPPPNVITPESSVWDPATDPRNLFDNNLATRWSANGDGAWFKVDLGSVRTLCSFAMAVYNGNSRRQTFDLQVSMDNAAWTNVLTNARSTLSTASPAPLEPFEFPDVTARWVRWVGHGNVSSSGTASSWNSITEVDFFVR